MMNKIIIILLLLFTCVLLHSQEYFCKGSKEEVQELQVQVQAFHEEYETNYNCTKWSIQEPDSITDDWHLAVSKVYFDINKPSGCRISKSKTIYKDIKLTSDGYYYIPLNVDEKDVMVQRIKGVPKKNIFGKSILVK